MSETTTTTTNAGGAPKSPYIRLAATDEAFGTIAENLAFMIGQKFYAGKKGEIEPLLAKAQVLRHELAAVVTGRFVVYEQAQLKKLAASGK
jgi:hypothetical protein